MLCLLAHLLFAKQRPHIYKVYINGPYPFQKERLAPPSNHFSFSCNWKYSKFLKCMIYRSAMHSWIENYEHLVLGQITICLGQNSRKGVLVQLYVKKKTGEIKRTPPPLSWLHNMRCMMVHLCIYFLCPQQSLINQPIGPMLTLYYIGFRGEFIKLTRRQKIMVCHLSKVPSS